VPVDIDALKKRVKSDKVCKSRSLKVALVSLKHVVTTMQCSQLQGFIVEHLNPCRFRGSFKILYKFDIYRQIVDGID